MPWARRLPSAMPGIGRVVAVADWLPNVPGRRARRSTSRFARAFPSPQDDYVHMRMQLMVEALAQAMEKSGSATNMVAVAGSWSRRR
jgi:branched-chain amino acid transport system substrate-binding protein